MHEKSCRICLGQVNWSLSRVDIFTESNSHLIRQIRSLTGVQIVNIKGQPRHMCHSCLIDLGNAIKFRQRCILSQKRFKVVDDPGQVFCKPAEVKCIDVKYEYVDMEIIEEYGEATDELEKEKSDSQIENLFRTEEIAAKHGRSYDRERKSIERFTDNKSPSYIQSDLSSSYLKQTTLPRKHYCQVCDVWFHRATHLKAHKNSRSHILQDNLKHRVNNNKMLKLNNYLHNS